MGEVRSNRRASWALIALCGVLLAVSYLSEAGVFGVNQGMGNLGDVVYLVVIGIAAAVCVAGAWARRDLDGWGLIGPKEAQSAQVVWYLSRFRGGRVLSTTAFNTEALAREAIEGCE